MIRALLIEDDRKLAALLVEFLGQNGVETALAQDGAQALQLLGGQKFDILRNAGEMFLRQRDVAGASDAFGKALLIKPSDRDLAMKLAEVHIADGRLVEAEEILSTLMRYWERRVALPMSMISSPVAIGSSVPAWPMRFICSLRRRR